MRNKLRHLVVAHSVSLNNKRKDKPSIPTKKPAKNGFTGILTDNPGPTGYNPKSDVIRSK
jgi:hypothetical protein